VLQTTADFVRRIRVPAYLLVAFLSVGSLIDILVTAWPVHLHDPNWRLAVANNAAGASGTEMLSLLILIVIAQLAVAGPALWAGFAFAMAMASGYAIAAVMFALDSLQVRGRIPAEQLQRYDVTVAWALARFAFTDLVCLWLAACAWSAARSLRRDMAREMADRRSGLIVGVGARGTAPSASPTPDK
jgi:hypothetical protein